jgi:hypothetical protein
VRERERETEDDREYSTITLLIHIHLHIHIYIPSDHKMYWSSRVRYATFGSFSLRVILKATDVSRSVSVMLVRLAKSSSSIQKERTERLAIRNTTSAMLYK